MLGESAEFKRLRHAVEKAAGDREHAIRNVCRLYTVNRFDVLPCAIRAAFEKSDSEDSGMAPPARESRRGFTRVSRRSSAFLVRGGVAPTGPRRNWEPSGASGWCKAGGSEFQSAVAGRRVAAATAQSWWSPAGTIEHSIRTILSAGIAWEIAT